MSPGVEHYVYYGDETDQEWNLPEGPYFDEYKQNLSVRVSDMRGASVLVFIGEVQVRLRMNWFEILFIMHKPLKIVHRSLFTISIF